MFHSNTRISLLSQQRRNTFRSGGGWALALDADVGPGYSQPLSAWSFKADGSYTMTAVPCLNTDVAIRCAVVNSDVTQCYIVTTFSQLGGCNHHCSKPVTVSLSTSCRLLPKPHIRRSHTARFSINETSPSNGWTEGTNDGHSSNPHNANKRKHLVPTAKETTQEDILISAS